MPLKLMYITNSPEVAQIVENAGIDRIFIDMEHIGKSDRQGGMDTVQSHHTVDDIKSIKNAVFSADVMVRVNPIHNSTESYSSTETEIDNAIKSGADILMLPYFKTADEVKRFVDAVGGRARTLPLLETPEAVQNVDEILGKLNTQDAKASAELMSKIMQVGKEQKFTALTLSITSLIDWIRAIIDNNDLKAIVFIWDEFTEYFQNNMKTLTGFQQLVDFAGSDPFYLVPVTHNVTHIFPETDNNWKKILGRFINPICNIELPENMAFQLMGAALEKTKDVTLSKKWEVRYKNDLYDRTAESRELIKKKAGITDDELKNILPIHPYTALMLKYISSAFDSNQRSMFDFIKNDRGDEVKGFQWYINNFGPLDENPLLTIDMLWDFFYEKGKEFLARDIRNILDTYALVSSDKLKKDEQRVLKAILLLQSLSQETGDTVELFIPNERNLNNAFEGSDLDSHVSSIAERLVDENVIFKRMMAGGNFQYASAINGANNMADIALYVKEAKELATNRFIEEGELQETIPFNGFMRLRFIPGYAGVKNFKTKLGYVKQYASQSDNKLPVLVTFAKNDQEAITINEYIREEWQKPDNDVVFIDTSSAPMGEALLNRFADAYANAKVNIKQDKALAETYQNNALDALNIWKNNITMGSFTLYRPEMKMPKSCTTLEILIDELKAVNRNKFPQGIENIQIVNDTMWTAKQLKSGVKCGAEQKLQFTYKSGNKATSLESFIG